MALYIDMTGKKIGMLTVKGRDETKKGQGAYWICDCDCGTKNLSIRGQSLRDGSKQDCGCVAKKHRHETLIDTTSLIGKQFGRLTVIERDMSKPIGHSKSSYWLCKCSCGNPELVSVSYTGLVSKGTKSCGCLHKEQLAQRSTKDITNQRFGHLVALYRLDEKGADDSYFWMCECDCGVICKKTISNLMNGVISCGCENRSKGEFQIYNLLLENNYDFIEQATFKDLVNSKKGSLRFDFAILEDNKIIRLIEFDGEQHYSENSLLWSENLIINDKLKNQYAEQHNIPLVRIPYKKLNHISIEDLMGDEFIICG